MKVRSVNIGKKESVQWKGKLFHTGIFKAPIDEPIYLGTTDVDRDSVIDRKYHGGVDKACYMFSLEHYNHFKNLYSELDWNYGMFGENITVEGFNEKDVFIGNTYKVGSAKIQISEPRQPCSTLSMRFNSHQMMKDFIDFGHCGAYVRVIEEGEIQNGDTFELLEEPEDKFSIYNVFALYHSRIDPELRKRMLASSILTDVSKKELRKKI